MIDESSLTHRGGQYLAAIAACRTRCESIPDSQVQRALVDATNRAVAALAIDPKYRLRDLPTLPVVDHSIALWERMKALDALRPPLPRKILTTKKTDDHHPRTIDSQPERSVIRLSIREGLPRRAPKNGKP
jgi:hypothetical protein